MDHGYPAAAIIVGRCADDEVGVTVSVDVAQGHAIAEVVGRMVAAWNT